MATKEAADTTSSQKQIFISYSREPEQNADFVRNLAGRLAVAGFSVWVDEQQLHPGDEFELEITKAANLSEVAIFVATTRWAKRPWTRQEVRLFGQRPDDVSLVVIEREKIDIGQLGPYLSGLHRITWPEADEEPDARFWEVYCGIERKAPGPRATWAERGRAVTGEGPPPDRPESPVRAGPRPDNFVPLPCDGKPVDCFVGDEWTFLVTNLDEWIGIRGSEFRAPLPRLSNYIACMVGGGDRPLVGLCDPMIARLQDRAWEYQPLPAPALSFCVGPDGEYAGTAAGTIIRLEGSQSRSLCQLRDPVIGLASYETGLVALGSQGMFGRLPLNRDGMALEWLESGSVGRPVGFFPMAEPHLIGLFGQDRLGAVDPAMKTVIDCPIAFDQWISRVEFLGPQRWPYAVLTDHDEIVLIDAALAASKAVKLPAGAIPVGCCGTGGRGVAAVWTRDGSLYRIVSPDHPAECLISGQVLLAYPVPDGRGLAAILWDEARGAAVRTIAG